MALIKCPECTKQMSSSAAACPQCGWKNQKAGIYKWTPLRIMMLCFLFFSTVAVAVIWYKSEMEKANRNHSREMSALEDELNAVVNTP